MSKVTTRQLAQAIVDLSAKTPEAKLAKEVAGYLVDQRRTGDLDAVMREVARLRAASDGTVEATVTSAYPLSSKTKADIKALLGAKKVILNTNVDKSVIGGVRVESGEQLLDLTVRNRLTRLKGAHKTV